MTAYANPHPEAFEERALAFLEALERLHTGDAPAADRVALARLLVSTFQRGGMSAARSLVVALRKRYAAALDESWRDAR